MMGKRAKLIGDVRSTVDLEEPKGGDRSVINHSEIFCLEYLYD
jgi:hypothetical protein